MWLKREQTTCLKVKKKQGAEATALASGVEAAEAAPEVPVESGADTAPALRKARTVGQIKVKAVSSKTLFT